MKRLGYKDVHISINELVELSGCLLKANSVKSYCARSAGNETATSWLNEPDPTDGRKILIKYSSIPQQTVKKYALPDVAKLIDQIKHDKALDQAYTQQQQLEFASYRLEDLIKKAADNEYAKFCPTYNKQYPGKRDKVIMMAKTHAVLQCCMDLRGGYTVAEIHAVYLKTPGIKITLKNIIRFGQKLKEWKSGGIKLVHACTGKPREHLVKMSVWHIGKIEEHYSHPNKYTAKQIRNLVNHEADKYGKKLLSIDSIAKYVARPEVKNRLSVYRDKAYHRRVVTPSTRRIAPTFAGDLYYADGSPLQITCWNTEHTKQIRLNLFVVMDVKSKKIVGFDLSENEDRHNWLGAFKMAFSTQMMLPFEAMYDNASATKTDEFRALKDALLLKGCTLNPTTKGEPKQKADIERWFNTFQSGYQRMIDGYYGEGIRSKRDNGRVDVEHLAKVQKSTGGYTTQEIVQITTKLIAIYNATTDKKGLSPNKIFAESEKVNAQIVTPTDIAFLFWTCRRLKVSNSEVQITIRQNDYYFEVYDHATALKLDGTKVDVYYDINDLSSVHLFDFNGTPICECRQKVRFHKAKANQTAEDVLQIIKQSSHNEAKKTVAKRISNEIAAKAMEGNEESFLQTVNPFDVAYKDAVNEAETIAMINYIENGSNARFKEVYEATPTERPHPVDKKKTIQQRHAKKNIQPASLEVITRP